MDDNWVVRGPSFNFENARNRICVQCICSQAIDSLGRQGDYLAGPEEVSGSENRGVEQLGSVSWKNCGGNVQNLFGYCRLP